MRVFPSSMAFRYAVGSSLLMSAAILTVSGCGRLKKCESKQSRGEVDSCYAAEAERTYEPKHCAMIESPDRRNPCYSHVAQLLKKPEICRKLDSPPQRDSCVQSVARDAGSAAVCDAIEGGRRDQCISFVAQDTADLDSCAKIQAIADRDECRFRIAIRTNRPSDCARIETESKRDYCLTTIASTMVGIGQGDAVSLSALCEQIKGPNSKKGCYGTIARVDPLLCERIGETETDLDRARCYQALSWDRAGIACDQIPNVAGQMSCYKDRAQRMRDPALCEKLGETRERDDCFSMLVTATGDASLCLRVRNPDVASNCVSRVDSSKLTYALCILLPKGYQRDKCIFDVKHAPRKP